MIVINSNFNFNSNEYFNDNIYIVMEENGLNIYIFILEIMSSFIRRGFGVLIKDNINLGKVKNGISKINLMVILN